MLPLHDVSWEPAEFERFYQFVNRRPVKLYDVAVVDVERPGRRAKNRQPL